MKHVLLLGLGLISSSLMAQKNDCKLVKMKMTDGTTAMMARSPGAIGVFLVGKYNGNTTMAYNTKALLASDPTNKAMLRIDSVHFVFVDNTMLHLKAYYGIGTLKNINREMQPHITNAQFMILLSAGSKDELKFKQNKLRSFTVTAEKGAQYGDGFNEKQQEMLIQSFGCVQ